jgi:TusA-related sulfurtransferase
MNFGEEVMIEATDPLSQIDIPHIIAQSKAQLISTSEKNGIFIFHVKCNKTLGQ